MEHKMKQESKEREAKIKDLEKKNRKARNRETDKGRKVFSFGRDGF